MFAGAQVTASREMIALPGVGDVDGQLVVLSLRDRFGSAGCLVRWLRTATKREDEERDEEKTTHVSLRGSRGLSKSVSTRSNTRADRKPK